MPVTLRFSDAISVGSTKRVIGLRLGMYHRQESLGELVDLALPNLIGLDRHASIMAAFHGGAHDYAAGDSGKNATVLARLHPGKRRRPRPEETSRFGEHRLEADGS